MQRSQYRFAPSKTSGVFYKVKSGTVCWVQDNCPGVDKHMVAAMPFEEIYEKMYDSQIDYILNTPARRHFERAEKFIFSLKENKRLYDFENNFDEIHRFFPERVFRMVCALVLISSGKSEVKPDSEISEVLEKLLCEYKRKGGDVSFISNYYFAMKDNFEREIEPREDLSETEKRQSSEYESFEASKQIYDMAQNGVPSPYMQIYNLFGQMASLVYSWKQTENSGFEGGELGQIDGFSERFFELEQKFADSLDGFDPKMIVKYLEGICTWIFYARKGVKDYARVHELVKDYICEILSGAELSDEERLLKLATDVFEF